MLYRNVNSLKELEEIKHLEAEAAINRASNNPPDYVSCNFLADINSLFNLQTLAYLGALLAFQGSDNRTLLVSPSS